MTQSLKGRTALVTGSVQGIGLAIARELAGAGARIALHGLAEPAQIAHAEAELHEAGAPEVRFFEGDLRDPAAIATLMQEVADWSGPDILVNNAGIQRTVPLAEATAETWDAVLSVNLTAASTRCGRRCPAWPNAATGG
jgi:3-hydroxybutyrate dehydrogenase